MAKRHFWTEKKFKMLSPLLVPYFSCLEKNWSAPRDAFRILKFGGKNFAKKSSYEMFWNVHTRAIPFPGLVRHQKFIKDFVLFSIWKLAAVFLIENFGSNLCPILQESFYNSCLQSRSFTPLSLEMDIW